MTNMATEILQGSPTEEFHHLNSNKNNDRPSTSVYVKNDLYSKLKNVKNEKHYESFHYLILEMFTVWKAQNISKPKKAKEDSQIESTLLTQYGVNEKEIIALRKLNGELMRKNMALVDKNIQLMEKLLQNPSHSPYKIETLPYSCPPPPPLPKMPNILPKSTNSVSELNYSPLETADLKQDYIREIKQVFTGEIRKPSEILTVTKPKFEDTIIAPLPESFSIPVIGQISTAKKFQQQLVES